MSIKLSFLSLFFLTLISPLCAQDFDDFGEGDFSNQKKFDENIKEESFIVDFWKKRGRGVLGSTRIIGQNINRGYSFLDLKVDYDFKTNTRVVLAGILEYTDIFAGIKLKRSVRDSDQSSDQAKELERKFEYRKFNARPHELYLKQDFFDTLSLSYGFQKIVLGQFEPFSPAQFSMPLNLSSLSISLSKVENTLPQESFILDFYPTDHMQLSLYYFPRLTYAQIIEQEFDDIRNNKSEDHRDQVLILPEGRDAAQKMARLVLYPSWGTLGFTYYDGYQTNFPVGSDKIERTPCDPEIEYCPPSFPYREYEEVTIFPKNEMMSVEMSIPVGNFTYKLEYSRALDRANISQEAYNAESVEGEELAQTLINSNQRSTGIPIEMHVTAIGFSAELTKWRLNLMLMNMRQRYKGFAQELRELEKKALSSVGARDENQPPSLIPGLFISRYLDPQKQSEIGFVAGLIGPGIGAALFYKNETDSFSYNGGFQFIHFFSDDSFEAVMPDGYELKDGFSASLGFGLSYNF